MIAAALSLFALSAQASNYECRVIEKLKEGQTEQKFDLDTTKDESHYLPLSSGGQAGCSITRVQKTFIVCGVITSAEKYTLSMTDDGSQNAVSLLKEEGREVQVFCSRKD